MSIAEIAARQATDSGIAAEMAAIGRAARRAGRVLALASSEAKNRALMAAAAALRRNGAAILATMI